MNDRQLFSKINPKQQRSISNFNAQVADFGLERDSSYKNYNSHLEFFNPFSNPSNSVKKPIKILEDLEKLLSNKDKLLEVQEKLIKAQVKFPDEVTTFEQSNKNKIQLVKMDSK